MKLGEKVIKTKVNEMSFQEENRRMGNREQNVNFKNIYRG